MANGDDVLGDMFLSDRSPTAADVHEAIARSVIRRTFVPVLIGSALKNKGVQPILDAVVRYLPNPAQVNNSANVQVTEDQVEKISLDPTRSSAQPFVGLAFKLEIGTLAHSSKQYWETHSKFFARPELSIFCYV